MSHWNDYNGGGGNDDVFRFDISNDPAVRRNLGAGDDVVEISADRNVPQVRLTFTSAEVGNGFANDSNTMMKQDGGLAVRAQAENSSGALVGPVSRFDDEGITFESNGSFTYDVRDLVSGVQRGDRFDTVELGTQGNDLFDESFSRDAYYINAGMGDDRLIGGTRNDFLVGGVGNDRLDGREGDDSLLGGAGGDTFIFSDNSYGGWTYGGGIGNDRILDFASGVDKIDLKAFGIDFGDVRSTKAGADTLIDVNSDSDTAYDFQIRLVNAAAPVEADYIFV